VGISFNISCISGYYQTPKPLYDLFYLASMRTEASNFLFLKWHDIQLVRLGALAERYFHDDANTCLIKLRQFGELLAQLIAAKTGLFQTGEFGPGFLKVRLPSHSEWVADLIKGQSRAKSRPFHYSGVTRRSRSAIRRIDVSHRSTKSWSDRRAATAQL
jgi:hypothetical protein